MRLIIVPPPGPINREPLYVRTVGGQPLIVALIERIADAVAADRIDLVASDGVRDWFGPRAFNVVPVPGAPFGSDKWWLEIGPGLAMETRCGGAVLCGALPVPETGTDVVDRLGRTVLSVREASGLSEQNPLHVRWSGEDYENISPAQLRNQPSLLFRVRAGPSRGMGHVYRCLRLAQELDEWRCTFGIVGDSPEAEKLLRSCGFSVFSTEDPFEGAGIAGHIDVLCNDVLNTTADDVLAGRRAGAAVVTLEDLGRGATMADWVVNALVDRPLVGARVSRGSDFAVLRAEFVGTPAPIIRPKSRSVTVSFGGSDPAGLTPKFVPALAEVATDQLRVVTGPEHRHWDGQEAFTIVADPASIAGEFAQADVVVTTGGRTVFEAAAMGIPTVSIAATEKEATHSHTKPDSGVLSLGLHSDLSPEQVADAVGQLLDDVADRHRRSGRLRDTVDGLGAARIATGIRMLRDGIHPFDWSS